MMVRQPVGAATLPGTGVAWLRYTVSTAY